MNRRRFLKTAGYSTIAGLAFSHTALSKSNHFQTRTGKLRVAIFLEPNFPAGDANKSNIEALRSATDGFEVSYLNASELAEKLSTNAFDVFINPYGSLFPKPVWAAILKF